MKKGLLITLCLVVFGLLQAQATTYYINDNVLEAGSICSAVGNDGNNGLDPSTPKTLNFVNNGPIVAGDIIYIDKGTYTNIWNCSGGIGAGTAANHIRFIGVDSSSTIIEGNSAPGSGTNAIGLSCNVTQNLYWDFSNLAIVSTGTNALYLGIAGRTYSYLSFTNCLIRTQGNSAIMTNGGMTNFTFTGCKIQSDQTCINLSAGGPISIADNTFTNCRINHIANNASTVVAIGNGTRDNNAFIGCTITNAGSGYMFDYPGGSYTNSRISRSTLRGNGTSEAVHLSNGSALNNFLFYNNYISNVQTGIACNNPNSGGFIILNNSFYTSGNCLGNSATGGYFTSASIKNNIFHTTGTATNFAVYISTAASAPTESNNNLYYTPSGANIGSYNGATKATLAAWQNSFASNDAASATGNPLYTSAATGDLSIPCSSPAFQTGVTTTYTPTDIIGSTRPATPSKGAFENVTVVTVTASPTSAAFCPGGSTSITASGATTYAWSPSTGLDATSGATVQANPTATATYTITGTSSGCTGTATVVVTVYDLPTIAVSPASPSICAGATASLTASGGNTYAWSPATDLSATTGTSVDATPSLTATYTVTGTDANTCTNTATVTVTVNSVPAAPVLTAFNDVCANAAAVTLSAGTPTGGTYSGTGVSAGSFDPSVSGEGTFTITYTITDANTCSASATEDITVNALPTAPVLTAFADICSNAAAVTLSGGTPTGGTYSGTGVSAGSFDPTVAGNGSHAITYTITDANTCSASAVQDIMVTVCTGINENAGAIATSIYPNPNDGSFLLTFDPKNSGNVEMTILNAQGKEQYRNNVSIPAGQSSQRMQLDLTPGIYHLQLLYEGSTYHEKVVIK